MNTDAFRDLLISSNYLGHLSALQIMMFEEINDTTFQENLNILVTHLLGSNKGCYETVQTGSKSRTHSTNEI